jgi:hypothetical protein
MASVTTPTYRVDLLRLGGFDWAPGFEMFWMEPDAPDGRLAIVSLLIRGGGRTILLNTGPDVTMLEELNAAWANFDPRHQLRVTDDERVDAALAAHGVSPADVDTVVVTPFQPYAVGNLLRFEGASYALSRTGWIAFHAPRWRSHPHEHRPFVLPPPILHALVGERWDQVRLLEDEDELAPGIRTFWTGGHHRSSLAVAIPTATGTVVASDCFFRFENVTESRPLGINESLEEILTAYERIRDEADVLIPLYDPRVFDLHPHGIGHTAPATRTADS